MYRYSIFNIAIQKDAKVNFFMQQKIVIAFRVNFKWSPLILYKPDGFTYTLPLKGSYLFKAEVRFKTKTSWDFKLARQANEFVACFKIII